MRGMSYKMNFPLESQWIILCTPLFIPESRSLLFKLWFLDE